MGSWTATTQNRPVRADGRTPTLRRFSTLRARTFVQRGGRSRPRRSHFSKSHVRLRYLGPRHGAGFFLQSRPARPARSGCGCPTRLRGGARPSVAAGYLRTSLDRAPRLSAPGDRAPRSAYQPLPGSAQRRSRPHATGDRGRRGGGRSPGEGRRPASGRRAGNPTRDDVSMTARSSWARQRTDASASFWQARPAQRERSKRMRRRVFLRIRRVGSRLSERISAGSRFRS